MRRTLLATAVIAASLGTGAFAAVELNTYADAEGYLDVQALTCAQLARSFPGRRQLSDGMVQRLVQRAGEKAFRQYPSQQRG